MKRKKVVVNGFVPTISDSDEAEDEDEAMGSDAPELNEENEGPKSGWALNNEFKFQDFSTAGELISKSMTNVNDFMNTRSRLDKLIDERRTRLSIESPIDTHVKNKNKNNQNDRKLKNPKNLEKDIESKHFDSESNESHKFSDSTDSEDSSNDDIGLDSSDIDEIDDPSGKSQMKKQDFFQEEWENKGQTAQSFTDLHISKPIVKVLTSMNIVKPTPIQAEAIPIALLGRDIVGGAATGSGKTAAFVIPILERLLFKTRKEPKILVLILCPTRELAVQCYTFTQNLTSHMNIRTCLCVGGLSLKAQEVELKRKPEIVIATPGRFIDHVRNSQGVFIDHIEIFVIDEADRMLEAGFSDELNEITKLCPKNRQTMLFSATMTEDVDELVRLSLKKPYRIMVDDKRLTSSKLCQQFIRVRPNREEYKPAMLLLLCKKQFHSETMIFFKQKSTAHTMRILFGLFGLNAGELHGSLTQEQRITNLENFRERKIDFLMVTDLAARGLDIKGVQTVINYDVPATYEIYIHRVGRTARAGRKGSSVTLWCESERKIIKEAMSLDRSTIEKRSLMEEGDELENFFEILKKLEPEVKDILSEEKVEKELEQAEMQLKKGKNIMEHSDEIMSRASRTWFMKKSKGKRLKS